MQHRLAERLHAKRRPRARRRGRPAEPGACGHAEARVSRRRSLRTPPKPWDPATRRWKSRSCRRTARRKRHLPLTVPLHREARVHGDGQRFDSAVPDPCTRAGPTRLAVPYTPALTSRPHIRAWFRPHPTWNGTTRGGRDLRAGGLLLRRGCGHEEAEDAPSSGRCGTRVVVNAITQGKTAAGGVRRLAPETGAVAIRGLRRPKSLTVNGSARHTERLSCLRAPVDWNPCMSPARHHLVFPRVVRWPTAMRSARRTGRKADA